MDSCVQASSTTLLSGIWLLNMNNEQKTNEAVPNRTDKRNIMQSLCAVRAEFLNNRSMASINLNKKRNLHHGMTGNWMWHRAYTTHRPHDSSPPPSLSLFFTAFQSLFLCMFVCILCAHFGYLLIHFSLECWMLLWTCPVLLFVFGVKFSFVFIHWKVFHTQEN